MPSYFSRTSFSDVVVCEHPLLIVFTYLTFPTIISQVFHEFGVFVGEVNPSLVWDTEIRDQDTGYATNSGNDERPPSKAVQ
jgi:hypothetical protein